jgi:hypothetical protein
MFKPEEHLMKIKGNDYLQVQWRLVWLRDEHKDWGIETEIINSAPGAAQVKATIRNEKGIYNRSGSQDGNKVWLW